MLGKYLLFFGFVALVILFRLIYANYWRRVFIRQFGRGPKDTNSEQVFQRLLDLRKLAEGSDPRFYRPGQIPRKPYLGWLEIADANWVDYYKAHQAAKVCKFL